MLPNGYVYLPWAFKYCNSTGIHLLSFLLDHEITHVLLGHGAEKASLVHLLDFLGLIFFPPTMIWAIFPGDSLKFLGQ